MHLRLPIFLLLLPMLLAAGCQSADGYHPVFTPVTVDDKPEALRVGYRAMNEEGPRNVVLNQLEIGIDAFQLGYDELSAEALDAALDDIERVWGQDAGSRQARRLWSNEGRKSFKGEPYERSMAYYYRGLLYIRAGDLENARACFRSGLYQDAFAEEEQHRADLAALYYLEAWCSLMLRDTVAASEPLRQLAALRPDLPPPTAADNLLLVAETGTAPVKQRVGSHGAALAYARGDGLLDATVTATLGTRRVQLLPAEDVYWQASTRGGRPVDHILHGKVVFKERWEATGSSLTTVGLGALAVGSQLGRDHHRDEVMIAGAGLTIVGVIASSIAGQVKPQADTRRLRNLPDTIHLAAIPAPAGDARLSFAFAGPDGRPVRHQEHQLHLSSTGQGAALAWARSEVQIVSGRYYVHRP